jgi:hypothetical protein
VVTDGPWFTVQQSCPWEQHEPAQQNSLAGQAIPLQGGVPHLPLSQYGWAPVHALPQAPQLKMSLKKLTHVVPQQLSPPPQFAQPVVPELVVPVVVVPVVPVVVVPVVVPVVLVVWAPPAPPVPATTFPPQPVSTRDPIPKR